MLQAVPVHSETQKHGYFKWYHGWTNGGGAHKLNNEDAVPAENGAGHRDGNIL